MNRKYAWYTWLLVVLLGSNAWAQTHPKKRASKPVAGPPPLPEKLERPRHDSTILYVDDWEVVPLPIAEPFDVKRVFTYADPMPTLNGQDAFIASMAAIHRSLVVPPGAPDGRVFVQFEVDKTGHVRQARIAKGLRADVDSAVVTATRQLPPFLPGRIGGQAVAVSIMVPVTIAVKKQP